MGNKVCHLSVDYNRDILSSETHTQTANFDDLLYSSSYIPLITRHTRITKNTDRQCIYWWFPEPEQHTSRDTCNRHIGSLPHGCINFAIKQRTDEKYFIKRIFSTRNKQASLLSFHQVNLINAFSVTHTRTTFSTFHRKYLELYNRHFPKSAISWSTTILQPGYPKE